MNAHRHVAGADTGLLVVCDHAAADIPPGTDLGLPAATMATHIAVDIGAGALATAVAGRFDAPAILGRWSRLVADTNRPPDHPDMIPGSSDGVIIPGNQALDGPARAGRLALHHGFHEALDRHILAHAPALLLSVHSFTPVLSSNPAPRPWPVALLWNRDERAIAPARAALEREPDLGGPVGCNEPYSGQVLNYTMDRHAEARGIAYIGFEVRQDLLGSAEGIRRWADILARAIAAAHGHLTVGR